MLGLAAKSGNVVSGEFSTEKAVKTGKAFLVIVADDSSDNTKKHFSDMTAFYEVPIYFIVTRWVRECNRQRVSRFPCSNG